MKRYLYLFGMMAVFANAFADDSSALLLRQQDGTVQSISAIGTHLTFSNGTLTAVNGTESVTISLADIDAMYFGDTATGVSTVATADASGDHLTVSDNSIYVMAAQGSPVVVTDLQGRVYVSATATGTGQRLTGSLQPGAYIVKVGKKSYKLILK